MSGIIGHQTNYVEAQLPKDLRGGPIQPLVGREPQPVIGVDRIETFILQLVGAQLVDQPDPSAFLRQVKENAATLVGDSGDGAT